VPRDAAQSALDAAFLSIWQQALVDGAKQVTVANRTYPIRRTAKRGLAQVDFEVDGEPYRALEQNPDTNSRWAALARQGTHVMQFLSAGRYIAVVAGGKLTHYSRTRT
jgi:hypothetical protein